MLSKEQKIKNAQSDLLYHGIKWTEHNNGYHFKIGKYNFYPTTEKWNDDDNKNNGIGIVNLIELIKDETILKNNPFIKHLSVAQISKIFLNNKDKSLIEKCEILHKEIYG